MAKTDGVARIIALAALGKNGGGSTNYLELVNKPKINNVELTGNKTLEDLGINIPELPIASADTLGGIKIGENLTIDENGVVSASSGNVPVYFIENNNGGNGYLVNYYGLVDKTSEFTEILNDVAAKGSSSFIISCYSTSVTNGRSAPGILYQAYKFTLSKSDGSIRLSGFFYGRSPTSPYRPEFNVHNATILYSYNSSNNKYNCTEVKLLSDDKITMPLASDVLMKKNTSPYTPTSDYNPATKKYVDDNKYTLPIASNETLGGIKIGENLNIDENGVVSASGGKTNYLGYIEDYTSDNRLDITNLEKGTYALGIKDRIGSQTLYLKVSHNGQEQTLDTELQIEATVVSNMVYFDVRNPIKDISEYDEAIRISFSYLNNITSEIVNTEYGISYNNTSGILSNSARYNTKISATTTDTEQTIRGKKTFNVLPESSVEPTNDNQFVNKKYVDDSISSAITDALGGSY